MPEEKHNKQIRLDKIDDRNVITIPIRAIPKPRMVASDRYKKRNVVINYFAWCKEIRLAFWNLGIRELSGALSINFNFACPDSWSKKKKSEYMWIPHTNRPDLDNLVKAILDALFIEDSAIYEISASKKWNAFDSITIIDYGMSRIRIPIITPI